MSDASTSSKHQLTPCPRSVHVACSLPWGHTGACRPVETSSDVSALLTVQQHNKRLRAALSAIAVGTPDLLPPFRIMGETQLRGMARKALDEVPPEEPTPKEVELFDGESHIHRRSESTPKASAPCSYCFGDKTVSMSDGSKRMCELCGGTGRVEVNGPGEQK